MDIQAIASGNLSQGGGSGNPEGEIAVAARGKSCAAA